MIELFSQPATYVTLLSLTVMLIVLDIDNVIFMSILTNDLSKEQQPKAKRIGLFMGMVLRGVLLVGMGYLTALDHFKLEIPFTNHHTMTIQNFITLAGGLFLMYKCTLEIHKKLEGEEEQLGNKQATLSQVLTQVAMINLIFSLDSVITAVGMVPAAEVGSSGKIVIMITGMMISMSIMFIFQFPISHFVYKHPTMKVLALAFLLLIGLLLVIEGIHLKDLEIPKGYIYFAMVFSLIVEMININVRKKGKPVSLHGPIENLEKSQK